MLLGSVVVWRFWLGSMYLAQVVFGTEGGKKSRRDLVYVAESYLAALLHNGQILGEWLSSWIEDGYAAYVHLARPNSFLRKYHSKWGLPDLKAVVDAFGHEPTWVILADDVPKRFYSWKRSKSLYFFTHALDDTSPVCCGDSGAPIPLYLLPLDYETKEDCYFWSRSYNYHHNIWLVSGELEMPAYKQFADPKSQLSEKGREHCAKIERATKKPTFYYLDRYYGRLDVEREDERLCPLCGKQ